ncbi:TonB-dependent siderophore receptor [Roseateles cellulosilyticus]|uniref:TonB-dependent receptor n=1 Tax=Pelomonas cellulosilytica TaxID=2906762 RepID=A0ABS8XZ87_9BURK|nr:TonB-dependent receptor [Pelomonas sp. P8]MCE4557929.1 TonB-dependent receptor [Pelomonas sp. P8]
MVAVLALCAMPASAQTPVAAAATAKTYRFDLPAASLVETLRAISRVSGVTISIDSESVTGKRAQAVSGTLTLADALATAIGDNDVEARATATGYWVAVANKLDIVFVVARRDQAETSFKADRSDTATRSGSDLMEIPGGVTIITSKVLETQQMTSIQNALANVSGMSFKQSPQGAPTFGIRGFGETALMVNGVADNSAAMTNVFGVERIEVLKGPQAILTGAGSLGGGVNVVIKKPQAAPIRSVMLQYGSHGDLTLAGDVAGAVTEDRRLSMRVIAAHSQARDNTAGFDGRKDDSFLPQLRWKDETTDLIAGLSYGKQHAPVPRYTFGRRDGVILPVPQLMLGRPEDGFETRQRRAFYQLEQVLSTSVTLISRLNRSLQETEVHVRSPAGLSYATGAANDAPTGEVPFFAGRTDQKQNSTSGDHYLRILGSTGPVTHKLSLGFNHNETSSHQSQWSGPMTTVKVYPPASTTPFGDLRADASTVSSIGDQKTKQYDTFLQDLMNWGDWSLLVNLRGTRYSSEGSTIIPPKTYVTPKTTLHKSTPGVGVVYALSPEVSLYTNYAEGFVPSTLPSCVGGLIPPKSTRNREVGAKFDLFDSKLSVTTAAYELAQSNMSVYNRPGNCYNVRDAQVTRGVELDAQGQVMRGLNALLNYTFTTAKDVGNPATNYTGVPKHKMSLWATYDLQGDAWRGLGLGLGVSATSRSKGSTNARYMLYTPGQAQLDASVFYKSGPWSTTFGVKNIGDRLLYATTVDSSFIPVMERRNYMLTVKRDFK